jgi:hypothetical protein
MVSSDELSRLDSSMGADGKGRPRRCKPLSAFIVEPDDKSAKEKPSFRAVGWWHYQLIPEGGVCQDLILIHFMKFGYPLSACAVYGHENT